jgi:acylphosphatase
VQGVNYRARVATTADRHGVVGRVANLPDGTVSIEVQGDEDAVRRFLDAVTGPEGASHAEVVERLRELPVSSELRGFAIVRGS